MTLTTFATNLPDEGRVDNVIMEFLPRTRKQVHAHPRITIRTKQEVVAKKTAEANLIYLGHDTPRLLMAVASTEGSQSPDVDDQALGTVFRFPGGPASYDKPLRFVLRFPRSKRVFVAKLATKEIQPRPLRRDSLNAEMPRP
jgi:hypothetical protein